MAIPDIDHRSFLVNLFISGFALLFFLAGFEAALRLDLIPHTLPHDQNRKFCEGPGERVVFHPEFGWTERPGARYLERMSTADDWSLVTINGEGFRDTYDSGDRRVMVLGDSYTRGTLADDNETFPFLLDAWTPDTAFKNYGLGNYGTTNQLMVYRNVSGEDHELVILAYFPGNDAENNVDLNPSRPQFALEDGELVLSHAPEEPGDRAVRKSSAVQQVQNFLRRNSAAYKFVNRRLLILENSREEPPSPRERGYRLNLTRALVEDIALTASREGADLLIVTMPPVGDVTGEARPGFQAYREEQREVLRSVAGEHQNTRMVELAPAFRAEDSPEKLYGSMDPHMDTEGYRLAAETIYGKLVEYGYVNDSDPVFPRDYSRDITSCP